MTNTIDGAYFHSPQSNLQQIMGNQQNATAQRQLPWMQIPQVPLVTTRIPKSVSEVRQTELIRFTGETGSSGLSLVKSFHQKRKLDVPDLIDTHRTKQFITEERMAAHFKGLRISSIPESENPVSDRQTRLSLFSHKRSDGMDVDAVNTSQKDDIHPRLVLSEELKRMQQELPILPSTLLSKLERPSMALVLWEPPSKHLRVLPTRDTPTPIPNTQDTNNNNNNNNNNSDTTLDLNTLSSNLLSSYEPMEL